MRRLEPSSNPSPSVTAPSLPIDDIVKHCNTYKGADTKRSLFQLTTTLVLFAAACALMVYGYHTSFWITALLYLPAAGLLTRIFIFQHDCGHGSFMHSAKANNWIGRALGILTFTPYDFWRRAHNMHHATSGDLDRRSIGGIDTITVREYQAMSKTKQRAYRLYRNPFVLLVLGTPYYTLIGQRLPFNSSFNFYDDYKTLSNESIWNSIMLTNLALVAFYGSLALLIGWGPLLAVYLPIVTITAWLGGWLFYIQHQFEETYWEKNPEWNMHEAALLGSSYYHLPKILQWFTGNIGLHHIHHLCLKIPNYKLQECMDAYPELAEINKLTVWESLDCVTLKLWDEDQNKLVPFTAAA